MGATAPKTVALAIRGPIARADLPGLCDRVCSLLRESPGSVVVCDAHGEPVAMLTDRDDIVALDSAIIQHPRVWEASGHLEGFTDPLVQCLGKCKKRWREDHLREAAEAEGRSADAELKCPECGGDLTEPRQFNLMF
jgi:hypothetical protein